MPRYAARLEAQPISLEELVEYVKDENLRIGDAVLELEPSSVTYEVLYAEPRGFAVGTLVYADGTDWNPGSGEGLYIRKSSGWTHVA